jgi:hypothetical protein
MGKKIPVAGMTAIVTGASSGIGLEFSYRLAENGCNIIMVSNQREQLEKCAAAIESLHAVSAIPLYVDLTSPDACNVIVDYLDKHTLLPDILINNAGIFSFNPIVDTPAGKINCFIDLHIRAVTDLSRIIAKRMKEHGRGYILNMSSMSCWTPMPGLAMYAATKAYIRVFSRSLNYELRDYGVKVMVACPGGIATDLFGLPPSLMRLAVRLGAVTTPAKFTRNALKNLLKGKAQYVNGIINRLGIVFVGITPACIRMLVKHLMLDKNIRRP